MKSKKDGTKIAATYHMDEQTQENLDLRKAKANLILNVDNVLYLCASFFVYKKTRYPYSAITSLSYSKHIYKMNFLTSSEYSYLWITLENGEEISYTTSTLDLDKSKTLDSKVMEKAYIFLQRITFQSRFNKISYELQQKGSKLLDGYTNITFFANGDVVGGDGTRLNLKESRRNKGLHIGVSYSGFRSSTTEPDTIAILESNNSNAKSIVFQLLENQDVWKALIYWLSEPGTENALRPRAASSVKKTAPGENPMSVSSRPPFQNDMGHFLSSMAIAFCGNPDVERVSREMHFNPADVNRFIFSLLFHNIASAVWCANTNYDVFNGDKTKIPIVLDEMLQGVIEFVKDWTKIKTGDYVVDRDELEFLSSHCGISNTTLTTYYTLFSSLY